MKTYDVLVVGSGTAGQTAAHELRAHGLEVALADNSGRPGGVCALAGCQAKKYFYEVTETVARAQHLIAKGIQASPVGDWAAILDQKNAFTDNIPDNAINAAGLVNTVKQAMLNGQTVDDLYNQSIMTPYPSRESDITYMLKPLLKK